MGCIQPTAPGTRAENRGLSLTAGAEHAAGVGVSVGMRPPESAHPRGHLMRMVAPEDPSRPAEEQHCKPAARPLTAEPPQGAYGVLG